MSLSTSYAAAVKDLIDGAKLAPLWWRLGLEQTITRYRRTLLGPFWLASSTVATAFSLTVVFGSIFGTDVKQSFPFIMAGIVGWTIVGGLLSEGANTYIGASSLMQIQKLPLSFHSFLQVDRMLINFIHQLVAFWLVMAVMGLVAVPHWQLLLSIPLVMLTALFVSIPVGMLSLRYRDINYLVGFVSQALFMLTPVFWRRTQVTGNAVWIVKLNPLAHMLEIIREPMLGRAASLNDWIVSIMVLLASMVVALISLILFRRRVVFWL